jgi:outer membrane immunogenic protein
VELGYYLADLISGARAFLGSALNAAARGDNEMKKFLLGTVGFVALGIAAPALAADMAVKAAPVPYVAPMYNWSGFYIGINGGWASSQNRYEWTGPGVFALGYGADATGGTVGGQIGYNWQAGSWVFGLEAQYNWADLSKAYYGPVGTWSVGSKVDGLGFFTGRIGYAFNNALFYVKGGAAVANNNQWAAWNGVNFATASNSRWGGTVGVGLEYGFSPNWSLGVEYMHAWLGNNDFAWTNVNFGWNNLHVSQDIDVVTLRLNYRFNAMGKYPVAARY